MRYFVNVMYCTVLCERLPQVSRRLQSDARLQGQGPTQHRHTFGASMIDCGGDGVESQRVREHRISFLNTGRPQRKPDRRATRVQPDAVLVTGVSSELGLRVRGLQHSELVRAVVGEHVAMLSALWTAAYECIRGVRQARGSVGAESEGGIHAS